MAGNEGLFQLRNATGYTRDGVAKHLNKAMGDGDRDRNAVLIDDKGKGGVTPKAVRNWELGLSVPVLTPKQYKALCELYKLDGLPALVRACQVSKKETEDHMAKRKAS